jgi:hypothetical protein
MNLTTLCGALLAHSFEQRIYITLLEMKLDFVEFLNRYSYGTPEGHNCGKSCAMILCIFSCLWSFS